MESKPNSGLTSRCFSCKKDKPKTEFYKDSTRSSLTSSECKECIKSRRKRYYQNNKEKCKALNRKHALKNRVIAKDKARKTRTDALAAYGGKCNCCNETTIEFLCIDHVNNDGGQHRLELAGYGRAIYKWLQKNNYPKDGRFQVLCHNCNMAKSLYGGCPHQGTPPGKIVRPGKGYINKFKSHKENKIKPKSLKD